MRTFVLTFTTIFISLYGSNAKGDFPPDIQRIKTRGEIVVAMHEGERPPFFMRNPARKWFGLDMDLAHDIAAKMGVRVVFNRTAKSFNEVVDLIEQGKADVAISKLSITPSRALRIRFSEPYVSLPQALLINRLIEAKSGKGKQTSDFINSPRIPLGVLENSSYVEFAKKDFPQASLVTLSGIDSLYRSVAEGKITAALHDDTTITYWLRENSWASVRVHAVVRPGSYDLTAFAVNWRDTHLLAWLNSYLAVARADKTLDHLIQQYVPQDDKHRIQKQ